MFVTKSSNKTFGFIDTTGHAKASKIELSGGFAALKFESAKQNGREEIGHWT
jgi:hypothetical protein